MSTEQFDSLHQSDSQVHRALVSYSSSATGEIRVILPSVTGRNSDLPVSFHGRTSTAGSWTVPDAGSEVIVAREDSDYRSLFLVGEVASRITVDSAGSVGIGTTSPGQELEISADSPMIRLNDTDTALSNNELAGGIEWYTNDTSGAGVAGYVHADGDGSTGAVQLRFGTGSPGAAADRMTIDQNGNVGIGTVTPASVLDVNGQIQAYQNTLQTTNDDYSFITSGNFGGGYGFYEGANRAVMVSPGGNQWELHVGGSASSWGTKAIAVSSAGAVTIPVSLDVTGNVGIGTVAGGWELGAWPANGDYMAIRVGDMAVNADYALLCGTGASANTYLGSATGGTTHVRGPANSITAQLAISGTTATATGPWSFTSPIVASVGTAPLPGYTFSGDPNTGMYRVTTDQLGFSTNGALRGRFYSGGLLMGGSSTGAAQIRSEVGTAALPNYTFYSDTDTGMYRHGTNSLGFSTNGLVRLHIDSAGHLLHRSGVDNTIFYTGNIACNYSSGAEATIHHYNRRANGNEYGLKMTTAGDTKVNAAWGRTLYFTTDAYTRASIQNDGFRLNSFPAVSGYNTMYRRTSDSLVGYAGSSLRYKENVVDADETWRSVYNLRPVDFDWNNEIHNDADGERHDYGLIAEETAITMPSVVASRVIEGQGDLPVPDSIQYEKLSIYLIPLVQDLNARLEALEAV